MSRIIKFRVWMPEAKYAGDEKMFYQETQYLHSFIRRVHDRFCVSHPKYLPFEFEDRLMQWTGIQDREGKDIYDGDIIKHIENEDEIFEPVVFRNGSWELQDEREDIYSYRESIEVVGNIYENPELIGGAK